METVISSGQETITPAQEVICSKGGGGKEGIGVGHGGRHEDVEAARRGVGLAGLRVALLRPGFSQQRLNVFKERLATLGGVGEEWPPKKATVGPTLVSPTPLALAGGGRWLALGRKRPRRSACGDWAG
ncbi:unnamed protein product, partial [Discosporangium mesarthrocarpum]